MNPATARNAPPTATLTHQAREAGYVMIEAVIAVALIALCAGAGLAAIVSVEHRVAAAQTTPALASSAQNVLTDLRAATAYDGAALAALAGRSTEFDVAEPAPAGSPRPVHVSVRVRRDGDAPALATVVVRDDQGRSITMRSTLAVEAPAPGSVVAGAP